VALGGVLRDGGTHLAMSGALGETLATPAAGYGFVYHLELALLFVTLVVIDLTVRLFRTPAVLAPDMLAAARAGLVLLVVSCGLGIWGSIHGDLQVARGLSPEVVGAAGVSKCPPGAVIHALQWLPMLAWGARRVGLTPRWRQRLVSAAIAGSVLILAYAFVQTLAGRSRFDAPPPIAALLVAGGLLLLVPWCVVAAVWCGGNGICRVILLEILHGWGVHAHQYPRQTRH
jgi:hypothetical protein